jgi:hypothetical protein
VFPWCPEFLALGKEFSFNDAGLTIAIDVSGEKTYAPEDPVPNMLESLLSQNQKILYSNHIVDTSRSSF